MVKFKEMDTVAFDLFCATGTGWVVNPEENSCSISVATFKWKDGFDEKQEEIEDEFGISEYFCCDVSYANITEVKEDDWNDAFIESFVINALCSDHSKLTDAEKNKIKKYLDVLCKHDSYEGLLRKGYLCYGGSPLYECDWNESRRCLERCMELKPSSEVANTLGYIYYYGRCSNGIPDYDKAYRYYSMAALDDNHESLYKVGDMFLKGLGIPVNADLADRLYGRVYDETKKMILDANCENKFADAALRIAGAYERNAYSKDKVYGKYLEADLGLKIREKLDYYGDSSVRKAVDLGLEKYKPEDDVFVVHETDPIFLDDLTEDSLNGNLLKVVIERKGQRITGRIEVVNPTTKRKCINAYWLLTIPQLSYCGFVRSYSFRCEVMEDGLCDFEDNKTETFFCKGTYNYVCEALFITEDGRSLSIESDSWTLRRPQIKDEYTPEWNGRLSF